MDLFNEGLCLRHKPSFFCFDVRDKMANTEGREGGCLCGVVRYRVVGKPSFQTICHCGNCRRATGAQSVAWVTFLTTEFSIVKGEVAHYHSETQATWSFCRHCGTTLTYENAQRPNDVDVTVGSLDDSEAFPPNKDVCEDEKLSWVHGVTPNI
jgi:hypothetical protein